ncbi:hypothetical protein DSUL_50058 [Desulfovibrionales bacterium]
MSNSDNRQLHDFFRLHPFRSIPIIMAARGTREGAAPEAGLATNINQEHTNTSLHDARS